MLTKAQKVRLGVFLLVGVILVGGGIALLAGLSLFKQYDYYKIQFKETVSGLSPGSPVKIRGVQVGRVETIRINRENVELVDVKIRVREGVPIMKGVQAQLMASGITGLKHIEISGAEKGAEPMEPGSIIPSRPSALTKITGKAEAIAFKAEQLLNNALQMTTPENRQLVVALIQDVRKTVRQIGNSAHAATELMVASKPNLNKALTEFRRSARKIRHAASSIDGLMGRVNREVKLTFAEARSTIKNLRRMSGKKGEANRALRKIRIAAETAERRLKGPDITNSLASVQSSLKAMRLLMTDLRSLVTRAAVDLRPVLRSARNASEHLEEFARRVRENPAALIRPSSTRRRKLPR
jgi:phospholipid/cholesterol/gamma-HCH transport system substrate-binding protein